MKDKMPTTLAKALAEIKKLRYTIHDLKYQISDYDDEEYYREPNPEVIEALARALELLKRGSLEAAADDIQHALLRFDCDGRIQCSVVVSR